MRGARRLLAVLLCGSAAGAALPPLAAARVSRRIDRIGRLVQRAEHSPYLWATVNECRPGQSGGTIGIRGEMPALGVPATLAMSVELNYLSTVTHAFTPLPGGTATRQITLGAFRQNAHQGGASFPFTADPGLLRATVTFTWSRGATVLGTVKRTTTAGHPQAAFGDPTHHSTASCQL